MDSHGKRNLEDGGEASSSSGALVVKKQKVETGGQLISTDGSSKALSTGVQRTSNLKSAIMLLSGHKAEIFSVRFNSSGSHLVSSSFDKTILVWNTYGDCETNLILKGHSNAVLEAVWSFDENFVFSASADKTVAVWDVHTGQRVKKYTGHTSIVNSVSSTRKGSHLIVSGSDDSTVKVWDIRNKHPVVSFASQFPVTSVSFSKESDQVFSGGIDNDVKVWNVKQGEIENRIGGHTDSITGIRLSPDGNSLLTNAMDNTIRIFDMKPYVRGDRCIRVFDQDVKHNFEKNLLRCSWSPNGDRISAGSAERTVNVWETHSKKLLYKLPGHNGIVNDVDFHPDEPIIASCSSDHNIYLGELR
eukprot:TRINITY_DN1548_c0_g1_i1.p1 TRINITY_DN1548_c0_g1~~TRINITY_DN1548_c0_g1_i1.p1  ORF type:complete len:359 (+),score=112.43 TRINITY_DN1548_c0_g1_i1:78-1154(+)